MDIDFTREKKKQKMKYIFQFQEQKGSAQYKGNIATT
jgi:hypothetical protein